MTDRVFACYANESVAECMRQMAGHQVRRMPVVDDRGRLVGIVAQSGSTTRGALPSARGGARFDEGPGRRIRAYSQGVSLETR